MAFSPSKAMLKTNGTSNTHDTSPNEPMPTSPPVKANLEGIKKRLDKLEKREKELKLCLARIVIADLESVSQILETPATSLEPTSFKLESAAATLEGVVQTLKNVAALDEKYYEEDYNKENNKIKDEHEHEEGLGDVVEDEGKGKRKRYGKMKQGLLGKDEKQKKRAKLAREEAIALEERDDEVRKGVGEEKGVPLPGTAGRVRYLNAGPGLLSE